MFVSSNFYILLIILIHKCLKARLVMESIPLYYLVQEGTSQITFKALYLFCIHLVTRHLFNISPVMQTMKVVSQK